MRFECNANAEKLTANRLGLALGEIVQQHRGTGIGLVDARIVGCISLGFGVPDADYTVVAAGRNVAAIGDDATSPEFTGYPCVASNRPVWPSQRRTVASNPVVTTYLPAAQNCADRTSAVCPMSGVMKFPFRSQSCAPKTKPVRSLFPSGETARAVLTAAIACEVGAGGFV